MFGEFPGFDFIPQECKGMWRGANKRDAGFLAELSKFRIFREESISRMNGIGAYSFGEVDNLFGI